MLIIYNKQAIMLMSFFFFARDGFLLFLGLIRKLKIGDAVLD